MAQSVFKCYTTHFGCNLSDNLHFNSARFLAKKWNCYKYMYTLRVPLYNGVSLSGATSSPEFMLVLWYAGFWKELKVSF